MLLVLLLLIPLDEPLATGFLLQRPPKQLAPISYQYERLSEFCYACGRLGHLSFHCPVVPRPPKLGKYGPKLKASSPYANKVELLLPLRKSPLSSSESVSQDPICLSFKSTQTTIIGATIQLSSTRPCDSPQDKLTHPISTKLTVLSPLITSAVSPKPNFPDALMGKTPFANFQLSPITSSLMLSYAANQKNLQLSFSHCPWSIASSSTGPTCTLNPALVGTQLSNFSSSSRTSSTASLSSPSATLASSIITSPNATLASLPVTNAIDTSFPCPNTNNSRIFSPHPPLKPPKYPPFSYSKKMLPPLHKILQHVLFHHFYSFTSQKT
jgi:hypothetical protein